MIRYRTGDLVTADGRSCACGRTFLTLSGGIVGRADDCLIVRGVNIYPSSIEAIVRLFAIDEFRIVRSVRDGMEELEVQIEAADEEANRLAEAFKRRLGLRIATTRVAAGTLPRFELKARRILDLRHGPQGGM